MMQKKFLTRLRKNSGFILLTAVWILVILTMLTIGLGRKTGMELALTRNAIAKTKARHLAWAGFIYAIDQIRQDTEDATTRQFDTKYQCGIRLKKNETPAKLFREVCLGEGMFDVAYVDKTSAQPTETFYGLQDEESRINLNGIRLMNIQVLTNLFELLGVARANAETIAASVVDWQDEDYEVTASPAGAEDDYYMSLKTAYHCKNRPFESVEELLLVRGMTREIFHKVKEHLTVFPQAGSLVVNFETAPVAVLKALARSFSGPQTQTDVGDADSLVKKMLDYRAGSDRKEGTADDRVVDEGMPINQNEKAIWAGMLFYRARSSNFLRVRVKGVDKASGVHSIFEGIVERSNLAVMRWERK